MSIETILAGLCTAAVTVNEVKGLGKIRAFDYYPDVLNPPVFVVVNHAIDFDESFGRGTDKVTVDCAMVVQRASERTARKALAVYVTALKAALEADRSLGGACDSLRVTRMSGYQPMTSDGTEYRLAAPLSVEVYATTT